jgi:hypothetical protein
MIVSVSIRIPFTADSFKSSATIVPPGACFSARFLDRLCISDYGYAHGVPNKASYLIGT